MKTLLTAALLLLPITLRAQDALAGEWKGAPAQSGQVPKAAEPIIASAEARMVDPAEKQKIREKLTATFTTQRIAFIKSADGIWEQEMFAEGAKARFPVTFTKAGKGETYEVHRSGKLLFIVTLFDADHLTLTGAKDRVAFPMIRDDSAAPSEGPRANTRTAGGATPPAAPKP